MNFENKEVEFYYNYLINKYKKMTINKNELARETSRSVSSINQSVVSKLDIPTFNKNNSTKGKNGKVTFTILNVARYLSNTQIVN